MHKKFMSNSRIISGSNCLFLTLAVSYAIAICGCSILDNPLNKDYLVQQRSEDAVDKKNEKKNHVVNIANDTIEVNQPEQFSKYLEIGNSRHVKLIHFTHILDAFTSQTTYDRDISAESRPSPRGNVRKHSTLQHITMSQFEKEDTYVFVGIVLIGRSNAGRPRLIVLARKKSAPFFEVIFEGSSPGAFTAGDLIVSKQEEKVLNYRVSFMGNYLEYVPK